MSAISNGYFAAISTTRLNKVRIDKHAPCPRSVNGKAKTLRSFTINASIQGEGESKDKSVQLRRQILAGVPLALGALNFPDNFKVFAEEAEEAAVVLPPAELKEAIFAGGCFWCMEPPFDKLEGVVSTTSGYSGGREANPNYRQVSDGQTGHAEALLVKYDPSKVTYEELLDVFWHQINPTQKNQQFCDRGKQYRSGIFYSTEAEKQAALASKKKYQELGVFGPPGQKLETEVTKAGPFWDAEEYHQDFYKKNPERYYYYRERCGRDYYLRAIWGRQEKIAAEKAEMNTIDG